MLRIEAGEYLRAFDAAKEAARHFDFSVASADPRRGIVETEPRQAGSVLEPWQLHEPSLGQTIENTLMHQRRRVRFEFSDAGEGSATADGSSAADLLGISSKEMDLTATTAPVELRVFVYMERSDTPGQRRSTWTRSKSSRYGTGDPYQQGIHWTVVGQDEAFARQLLGHVHSVLVIGHTDDPEAAADDAPSAQTARVQPGG